MNKDVFSGFIQGIVAMYKQNEYLDPLLEMNWDIRIRNGKCLVKCEYNTFICDRLIIAGDYDNEPEYKTIRERNDIVIECEISNNLEQMAYKITHEILDELTTLKLSI